jgi:hypothetical protein
MMVIVRNSATKIDFFNMYKIVACGESVGKAKNKRLVRKRRQRDVWMAMILWKKNIVRTPSE